jgi:hypothetical protein
VKGDDLRVRLNKSNYSRKVSYIMALLTNFLTCKIILWGILETRHFKREKIGRGDVSEFYNRN